MSPAEQIQLLQQAMSLHQQGRLKDAEPIYRRVLVANPRQPAALHLLGVIALQVGQHAQAAQLIRTSLQIDPSEAGAWSNCGEALRSLGNAAEAAQCYREAITRAPQTAIYWCNLGNALAALENHAEAENAYRRALELQPGDPKSWYNLGALFRTQNRFAEAETTFRHALELQPSMPEVWNGLGSVYRGQLRHADAEACYRRSIEIQPGFTEAWSNLGTCLREAGRLHEAENCYRTALKADARSGEACSGLGSVLRESGRGAEAAEWYERACQVEPRNPRFLSNLLFAGGSIAMQPDDKLFASARAWGQAVTRPPLVDPKRTRPPVTADRPLRIGYLSSDLRHHAVAHFMEPLLAAHDASRVEVHCFASVASPDAQTAALRARCPRWHEIQGLPDAEAARLIASKGIDVLIELGGHTGGSRLAVLAHRPAPVQASYLGYFATTGLASVDYWISDAVLHPADTRELTTEKIWRLPRCWIAYGPPPKLPDVASPASGITFGSFNHLAKLGPATLDLWAAVLRAIPEARLLLKTRHLGDPKTRERLVADFTARGVAAEAIQAEGHTAERTGHLSRYGGIDIALDPLPFNGGTTTAEALLMGVPVLTRCGATMPARMSASMLTSLGLDDLICHSDESFVARAVAWAREWQALSGEARLERRRAVRTRMIASPLCDTAGLARTLEDAYAGMIENAGRGRT